MVLFCFCAVIYLSNTKQRPLTKKIREAGMGLLRDSVSQSRNKIPSKLTSLDGVIQFGAVRLRSISANNRLILRTSSRLRSGSFINLSLARVSSSSRSSSANSSNSFSVIQNKTMPSHQTVCFFESSPLKWLSTSSRLSGFTALVNTTE